MRGSTSLGAHSTEKSIMSYVPSIAAFLACKRIAVTGVSRSGRSPANAIATRLQESEHEVFFVNPRTTTLNDRPCYPNLAAIPGGVDAVMIASPPSVSADIVRQCIALHIHHIWFHRSIGTGSVDAEAVELARQHSIVCIVGGCPLMFIDPVDPAHRLMRWWYQKSGRVPSS